MNGRRSTNTSSLTLLCTICVMLMSISPAHAVTCAQGRHAAGCAGNNGAVVVHKPVVPPRAVVVSPKPVVVVPHCTIVNGVKVCK